MLDAIEDAGLRIENLTTNGVLLLPKMSERVVRNCDLVTVSLNTGDESTYASMMKTPARNFHRVVENVRALVRLRNSTRRSRLEVNLQFLVWKDNFRTIPEMYALARSLGVDTILFNGLAFLPPEKQMTKDETEEMLALYKTVLRHDEYRTVRVVESYEQDISVAIEQLGTELAAERAAMPRFKRLWNLVRRRDYTLREKLAHHRRIRHVIRITAAIAPLNKPCVIGWYSMLIRTTGDVVPCCILQGARLGSILEGGVKAAWQSPAYQRFRAELKETFDPHWEHDPSKHATVQPLCGATGRCPVMSYYVSDIPFAQNVSALTPAARSL